MTQAIPIARDCSATCFTHWTGYAVSARRSTTRTGRITVALLSALTLMSAFADGTALVLGARPAALVVAPLALWALSPFWLALLVAGIGGLVTLKWQAMTWSP